MKKGLFIIILSFTLFFVGCGKSDIAKESKNMDNSGSNTSSEDKGFTEEKAVADSSDTKDKPSLNEKGRKIIDTADLTIETTDFNNSLLLLEDTIKKLNGYKESSNIFQNGINNEGNNGSRSGEFTVRIPNDKFETFLSETGKVGVIVYKTTNAKDISSEYYDRDARLKVLNAQEERYLAILSEAKNVEEILQVEKSLTEIRYEIEEITGYLKQMDSLVDYSTVTIHIQEVLKTNNPEKKPVTFGEKVAKTFKDSLKSLKTLVSYVFLFLVFIIPYGIIIGILGYIILKIYKYINHKTKKK